MSDRRNSSRPDELELDVETVNEDAPDLDLQPDQAEEVKGGGGASAPRGPGPAPQGG